jgi:hypothetical protein
MKVQDSIKAHLRSPVRMRVQSCALDVPAQFASSSFGICSILPAVVPATSST